FTALQVILVSCAYAIWLERRLSAWMQDRVGPNRVGPWGLLQPIADGLKFFLKEDYTPNHVDRALFTAAPALLAIPSMIGFVVIPWGGVLDLSSIPFLGLTGQVRIVGADVNIGVVYMLAMASLSVYGVALGSWASNNKFAFLGGLRASAQIISYEIPMGVCMLAVILMSGSFTPGEIIAGQQQGVWNIIQHPVAAILFYTCMLAETNRLPFDLAECESELVGGYHTEYSSMRFALFFLAEYFNMIASSALFCVLFLGGWSVNPLGALVPGDLPFVGGLPVVLAQIAVMAGKTAAVVTLGIALRWTLPRFRFDQLMRLAWEGMIPSSLLVLTCTAVFMYFGLGQWMWAGSLLCLAVIWFVGPRLPRGASPNAKIAMLGSRFSPA
ncbi:MAG: NADH-quinone oxidoreductase subunit NuoH, partial [Betaproteobacteria bacterium]|nr:NADH-quinone oxidoreductase subunit NuoH [Betaproteobacteria bacterium]